MQTSLEVSSSSKVKKRKINEELCKILEPGEQDQLYTFNFKIIHLKDMCKHYNQRTSGKKEVLVQRLYDFLRYSLPVKKIQTIYRRYLLCKLINAKGPAFIKRGLCVNETDFLTMEPVRDIEIEQFVSFKDMDGKIYGFDMLSLYNLWIKCDKPSRNPYNRNILPLDLENKCNIICKFSSSYFNKVNTAIEPHPNSNDNFESRALSAFQEINALGNYADHNWFTSLTRTKMITFIREITDIWLYRAELIPSVKRTICPPHGNPFLNLPNNALESLGTDQIRHISITIIERMVLSASDASNRSLGSYFILCALTLVSDSAASSFPWLYQSVVQY